MSQRKDFGYLFKMVRQRLTRGVLTCATAFRTKRLIVFLTPGHEFRSGGVISIAALYRESAAMEDVHRAKVAMCATPGEPFILKYSWFKNRNYILNLESLLRWCGRLDYLLLHIPEYTVNQVSDWLTSVSPKSLRNVRQFQLNVLIQNIDEIRGQNIAALMRFGKVTCTTAHEAYTTPDMRQALGVSLHRLGTCNGPELYTRSSYQHKENVLIVSNDAHPLKEQVLRKIAQALPDLRIQVVQNLCYEDYGKLAGRAKWSLTFGEGLDGYFVDPVFSGGVSFAVFNERFFTPAFANLTTVYPSWEILMDRIAVDLRRLDEPVAYEHCGRQAQELLSELYSTKRFRENLRRFYRGEYTFP